MASQRFWSRVLGKLYTPSRRSKPLFTERRIDNLFGADKYGRFPIFEPLVKTLDIDAVDNLVKRREPIRRNDPGIALIASALGNVVHNIQPAGTEVWEVESITIQHDEGNNENFEMHYTDEHPGLVRIHQLFDDEGYNINTATATQIFPYFHDIHAGGNHDGHNWAYGPLEVSHLVYLQITNVAALTPGTVVAITYMYRRVKL